MKIGIYGGSFNPIHIGHQQIALSVINEFALDKLFFVPAFKSPFKSSIKYAKAEDRVQMIELVKPEKSEVSLFELNRKGISYTIETVNYFASKYKDDELFLIIGSDNVPNLNKWKQIDEIAKKTSIIVYRRDEKFEHVNLAKYNCTLVKNKVFNFSSTAFRNGQTELMDPKVLEYIGKNMLYVPDLMLNMLDAKRHKHSIAVARLAVELAKSVKYDVKKAWFAASMHDITKCWPKEKHRMFLQEEGIDQRNISDFQLHSLTGYFWLKNKYHIRDEEILNAVLKHTSLDASLSTLDKIIFVADKLADGRKFNGIQQVRKLVLENFDEGFKVTVKAFWDQLKLSRNLTQEQEKVFERWIK